MTVQKTKTMSFAERLAKIDELQARRFAKLDEAARRIAWEGITRHLKACDRLDVLPCSSAAREIIDDAIAGRSFFTETDDDALAA